MKKVKLIYKEDKEGMLGIMLADLPQISYPMATNEGLLIAHDILEHQNGIKSIGSVGDEIEAMGGIWFIRGQYGDIRRDGRGSMFTPEESIASDIVNLGVIHIANKVPYRVKVQSTRETYDTTIFREIAKIAKKDLIEELACNDIVDMKAVNQYINDSIHIMTTGFRKAKRRFKNDALTANRVFWNIADTVDNLLKHAEYEGQEFYLYYDNSTARWEENYGDY